MIDITVQKETKIRYEVLDELLEEDLSNITYTSNVNCIIDLKSVIKKYFRDDILSMYDFTDRNLKEFLISDVLNTIAHYRNYFYKHGKYSTFYLIYSENKPDKIINKYPNYKKYYYNKYTDSQIKEKVILNKLFKECLKFIKDITNKLPNCIYIDSSEFDELLITRYILEHSGNNTLNFILTNDKMFYQLTSNNSRLLLLKGLDAKLLNKNSVVNDLLGRDDLTLSSNLIPFILSLRGFKPYSIDNIQGFANVRSFKALNRLIEEKKIIDTKYISFPLYKEELNILDKYEQKLLDNYDLIYENFNEITLNDIYLSNSIKIKSLLNKVEYPLCRSYLLELNSKVFLSYPILIDMIVRGEQV